MQVQNLEGVRLAVVDNFCHRIHNHYAIPGPDWGGWEAKYDNMFEKGKRAARFGLSSDVMNVLEKMQSEEMINKVCESFGKALIPDPLLHGGGLHVMSPDAHLSAHLDYDRHPKLSKWRRALNLIAFVHREWDEKDGGLFTVYSPIGSILAQMEPKPGRLIVMECSDLSYHGVTKVTGTKERVSVACYYLEPATEKNTRQRAMFFPNRD